ncbi:MAG: hypothetical protein Q9227_002016 [Pyrenula ochraceoflavens]
MVFLDDALAEGVLPSAKPTKAFWQEDYETDIAGHRTTKDLPDAADVIVIGSGISGAFAARELIHNGCNVLLLEARTTCSGATGRNGGHCQPHLYGSTPEIVTFELQNYYALANVILENEIQCEYQQMKAGCHPYFSKKAFAQAKEQALEFKKAMPEIANLVEIVEGRDNLAALAVPNAEGAILQHDAASLSPYKLITAIFTKLLKSQRLNLQTTTPVTSITVSDHAGAWKVHTPRGDICTEKGDDGEAQEDYLIQRPVSEGGELMFGGGRLLAKRLGYDCSDDSFNDDHAVKYLKTSLDYLLDDRETSERANFGTGEQRYNTKSIWTGIFGLSVDGCPWVGPVPQMPGIFLAAGYSGHGMPNAALCAAYAASLIVAETEGPLSQSLRYDQKRDFKLQSFRVKPVPKSYLITKKRIDRAKELPRTRGFQGESVGIS